MVAVQAIDLPVTDTHHDTMVGYIKMTF